jgi:hypothetical protein
VKLLVRGTNMSSTAGPLVNLLTTADDNPLMQLCPYGHDFVNLAFDVWWNRTSWVSSSSTDNFILVKNANEFRMDFAGGVVQEDKLSIAQDRVKRKRVLI